MFCHLVLTTLWIDVNTNAHCKAGDTKAGGIDELLQVELDYAV